MSRVQFRIGTLMLFILAFGIYFNFLRTSLRLTGITGLSVELDSRMLPAIFVHVTKSVVRSGASVTVPAKLELIPGESVLASFASALAWMLWRRAIRMRRARLDRQFADERSVDRDNRGSIRELAQFTASVARPVPDQSGEPKRV